MVIKRALVLIIGIVYFGLAFSQNEATLSDYQFTSISTNDGLLQSSVLSILQDKHGFIWMATKYGLNRYDGYKLNSYRHNIEDPNSIGYGEVICLVNDLKGDILIGTRGSGLNKYIYKADDFITIQGIPTNAGVNTILEGSDGTLWVGTDGGLYFGEPIGENTYSFVNHTLNATYTNEHGILRSSNKLMHSVHSMQKFSDNLMIVGTGDGIFYYNIHKNEFNEMDIPILFDAKINAILKNNQHKIYIASAEGVVIIDSLENGKANVKEYQTFYDENQQLKANWTNNIVLDSENNLWGGSRSAGLFRISDDGNLTVFSNNGTDGYLGDNAINSLLIDKTGVLWIGTESRGCYTLDLNRKKFQHLELKTKERVFSFDYQVTAITGNEKSLWIGTATNGIAKLTKKSNGDYDIERIENLVAKENITTSEIISLQADSKGDLWVGMPINSLVKIDKNKRVSKYAIRGFVFSLHEDKHKNIWFGTWGSGMGMINTSNESVLTFSTSNNSHQSLNNDIVLCFEDDAFNNLWIGTKGGGLNIASIDILTLGESGFVSYVADKNDTSSISNNDINCIHQSSDGTTWIGTGNGLNKVVYPEGNSGYQAILQGNLKFESYYEKDGLANNVICGILEDDEGNLWISTLDGLTKFNPKNKECTNFSINDGLQSNEFHTNAYYQINSQEMIFGGPKGVSVFKPSEIYTNSFLSDVVITSLKVSGVEVLPNKELDSKIILNKSISDTKSFTLYPNHKEFSLDFSGMHYANIQNVKYKYRLQGFNNEWRTTKNNVNSASYTNIREGEYVFQIKATNNDGVWNETMKEVQIEILPPFWRTPLFYALYFMFIMVLLFFFRKYSLIANNEKNELRIEALERDKMIEMTESRMRFFTNISHEIRTPLTLIYSPLDRIVNQANIDNDTRSTIKLVRKNVQRLLSLTDQLLQLRKMDIGMLEPQYQEINCVEYIKDILEYFENQANSKSIVIRLNNPTFTCEENFWIDKEMITTTLYNLLSNALKYTKLKGEIEVSLSKVNKQALGKSKILNKKISDYLLIEIADNGIGIPQKELSNIFYRFYQSSNKNSSEYAGSGVGLSIVKEYIELHKGVVTAASEEGVGTTMKVYLPLGDAHIKDALKKDINIVEEKKQIPEFVNLHHNNEPQDIKVDETINNSGLHLLIVDDDADMLGFLSNHFKVKYKVSTASNGKIAWNIVQKELPDIVLSDIMMPEIDGTALCNLIKSEVETSHIPVILLTAKVGNDNIIEGYENGADRYISKPFSINVLEAQVAQLLATRQYLIDLYSKKVLLKPRDITITSTDEKFLTQLMDIIEENLSDSEFDVAKMVEKMNMSHSAVLKKLKALTNTSLVDFVRRHRLNKAAMIFEKQKMPVSEVAYMVGFSDPKYFSKCFSKQFGKTPSEFISAVSDGSAEKNPPKV